MILYRAFLLFLLALPTAFAQSFSISTIAGGALPQTPAAGTSVSLSFTTGMTSDASGNIYLSTPGVVLKLDRNGQLTRIAGTGVPGYGGDNGPAINAQIVAARGLAFDSSGNLFIGDLYRIRRVTPDGIITTYAGRGTSGISGDGGQATAATIGRPFGMAIGPDGFLYFADEFASNIRRISPTGVISTFLGNSLAGTVGTVLNTPQGIAFDDRGNLWISDFFNGRFVKASLSGAVTELALPSIGNYVAAGSGNIYIFSDGSIRKIDGNGAITVVTSIPSPAAMAIDPTGNLYFARQNVNGGELVIQRRATNGTIATVAGTGRTDFAGDGGPALQARIAHPYKLTLDARGNVYFIDSANNLVRKVSTDGILSTVAGNGSPGFSGDNGPATRAQLFNPTGIAVDADGSLYIADSFNFRIRRVSPDGIITTFAGTGNSGESPDGTAVRSAGIGNPSTLRLDRAGVLHFSTGTRIRKILPDGTLQTVAGTGASSFSGDNGPAIDASFGSIADFVFDKAGNLVISDQTNNRIRRIESDNIVRTIAGNGRQGFPLLNVDARTSPLQQPMDLALDGQGNLYFTQVSLSSIYRLSPDSRLVQFAGIASNQFLSAGDGADPRVAQFGSWSGLAAADDGSVYLSDINTIRLIQPVVLTAVQNAASNVSGPIAPGEIIVLKGQGLGPWVLDVASPAFAQNFPTQYGGTVVKVNGIVAPLIYTYTKQVAAVVPYGIRVGFPVNVDVTYAGMTATLSVPTAAARPAVFTLGSTGTGPAAALNQDNSINTSNNPIAPGDVIVLYATGEGQTTPTGSDGVPSFSILPKPVLPVTVSIGGQSAEVVYAGAAPQLIAGLMQVNARVPANTPAGAIPVTVNVGGIESPSGVTIYVRPK